MPTIDAAHLAGLRRGLLAFCYQLLGSPFDAEDAVQDALERVWRARDSFDPSRASLGTWAYGIARTSASTAFALLPAARCRET